MITRTGKTWAARAYWYDETGTRRSKYKGGFRTKAAAQAWDEEYSASMTPKPPEERPMTLAELQAEYTERLERKGSAPRTLAYYEASARAYLPILGDMPAAEIRPLHVQRAVDAMSVHEDGRPYRSATVRGRYRALRAVLNYGVTMGVLPSSPCKGIDLPREQAHEAHILSGKEIARLLGALADQDHPLYWPVSFCARYALRRGEALAVRWQDIEFDTGLLHVRANITVSGSDSYLKNAKTRSSETTVALSDEFLEELRALRNRRRSAFYYVEGSTAVEGVTPLTELNPREFVCLNADGGIFYPQPMGKRLHSFQDANDLPRCGWHDLRHSYGTLMAEAGVDVVTISKAMRHSGIGITSDQYITGTNKLKRAATDKMAEIISFSSASSVKP